MPGRRAGPVGGEAARLDQRDVHAEVGDLLGEEGIVDPLGVDLHAQLLQILVDGGEVQACSVEQFVHHAYGKRELDGEDRCVAQQVFDATDGGQVPLLDLVVAFVASDAFTHRRITE